MMSVKTGAVDSRCVDWFIKTLECLLLFGFVLYLAGFYFSVTSRQNTLLYLLVFVPVLVLSLLSWRKVFFAREVVLFAGVLSYFTLSSLWVDSELSQVALVVKYGLYLVLLMLACFFCCKSFFNRRDWLPELFVILGLGMTAVTAVYYISMHGLEWLFLIDDRRLSAVSLLMVDQVKNPINSAALFGLSILGMLFYSHKNKNKQTQVVVFILGLLLFVMMWMTKSRGPILALLMVLTVYAMLHVQRKVLFFCLLGVGMAIIGGLFFEEIATRFMQDNYRLEIWRNTLDMIGEDWLFGTGLYYSEVMIPYGKGFHATHSHSFFIDALRVGGVVGASLLLVLLLRVCWLGFNSSRRDVRFCLFWLIFGCLCLMTNGQLLFYRPSISWLLFWLPLFLIIFLSREAESEY